MNKVKKKIESVKSNSDHYVIKIYFKGRELIESKDSLQQLGIIPNSKLLAVPVPKILKSVVRFKRVGRGWSYYRG